MVDVTQTAGLLDIDVEEANIDFLIGTGHKSLLGPPGVGFIYINNADIVDSLYEGGSGDNSASLYHPYEVPDKFEAGTPNLLGIVGLGAGIKYLLESDSKEKYSDLQNLTSYCWKCLSALEEVILYGTSDTKVKVPIISFNILNCLSAEIAHNLDKKYQIAVRSGLHCSPLIHKSLGTYPKGTVRISFGFGDQKEEVDMFIEALKKVINCIKKGCI